MVNSDEIPEQARFLYNKKWNKEKDSMLLRSILTIEQTCGVSEGKGYLSPHARLMALGDINAKFGTNLRLFDINNRLDVLHTRYKTFRDLMKMPETTWCRETNVLTSTDDVWERVFEKNVMTKAYYHQGEPEYYKMCAVFGLEDIKHEPVKEIIDISDTVYVQQLSSDEEVTSPLGIGDDATRECAGAPRRSHLYVEWPPCTSRAGFSPPNAFPRNPRDPITSPTATEESSGALWSPKE